MTTSMKLFINGIDVTHLYCLKKENSWTGWKKSGQACFHNTKNWLSHQNIGYFYIHFHFGTVTYVPNNQTVTQMMNENRNPYTYPKFLFYKKYLQRQEDTLSNLSVVNIYRFTKYSSMEMQVAQGAGFQTLGRTLTTEITIIYDVDCTSVFKWQVDREYCWNE